MFEKILVIEDDADINRILCKYLTREQYQAVSAYSGTEARLQLRLDHFDLILLDLMLPGVAGEELIREIRGQSQVPIMVISAKTSLEDKVKALKDGADDYITKPFEREEVLARIGALLRRSRKHPGTEEAPVETIYRFKQLSLCPLSRKVTVMEHSISLTAYEYEILLLMLQSPERVFTKEQLYQDVWKAGYYGEDNTINVHISNIRKKIKEYDDASYIKTVWGIGFTMDTM
ncbi:DNA-binding response OmpR family regulator [Anaerotaenia torta]|uniref:response regulator transcription factor n=1 Tax=Anaerotaenia torta TaxID=433293 RepID=UPI003D252F4B